MDWQIEQHRSYEWLQWMREVAGEPVDPILCLRQILQRAPEWDDAVARDRHSTGDLDRISSSEHVAYATSMLSRAAKQAVDSALQHATEWSANDPMRWASLPVEERTRQWETAYHVLKMTLDAWDMLWRDLCALQLSGPSAEDVLAQWKAQADQAAGIVTGASVAAWAQRR